MSDGARKLLHILPSAAVTAAVGAALWLAGYWSWRSLSLVAALALVRAPMAILAWITRVGLGADHLRKTIEASAVGIDAESARKKLRMPSIMPRLYAHAIRRLGAVEKDSSLARRFFQDAALRRESVRGRQNVLRSLRINKDLLALALGDENRLSAFLSLNGAGNLDLRERAAAIVLLAKGEDGEAREVAAYHLDKLLREIGSLESGKEIAFNKEELEELQRLRDRLDVVER